MLEGEPLPGAAESGHDLVTDPQHVVCVAQAAEFFEESGRRYEYSAARAADPLEEDRRGPPQVKPLELRPQPRDALGGRGAALGHRQPADLRRGDRLTRLDERTVGCGVPGLPGRAERAGRVAVVAHRTRHKPVLVAATLYGPVQVGELHRDLVRLGPAAHEHHVVEPAAEPARHQVGQALRGGVPELGAVYVVDSAELVRDGREDPRMPVPERDGERTGGGVDVVQAVRVEDPGALRGHGQRQGAHGRRDQCRQMARRLARCGAHRAAT